MGRFDRTQVYELKAPEQGTEMRTLMRTQMRTGYVRSIRMGHREKAVLALRASDLLVMQINSNRRSCRLIRALLI